MKMPSILAAVPMLALASFTHAADWKLQFDALGTIWGPDAAVYPLTRLTLLIHTGDVPMSGPYSGSMGQGLKILDITGTRNGVAVTGLESNLGTPYSWTPDLTLYVNSPQFISLGGLSYTTATGNAFNLYGSTYSFGGGPPDIQWFEAAPFPTSNPYSPVLFFAGIATLTQVVAVPEPSTWALTLTGAAMLGGLLRNKRRADKV